MVAGLLVACGGGTTTAPETTVRPLDLPFLVTPDDGYPLTMDAARSGALRDAFASLRLERDANAATVGAEALLAADPTFHPADVLLAQVALVNGSAVEALARLDAVVAAVPDYLAAQVVRGFAAEGAGDPLIAFESFSTAAERQPDWADQAQRLQPRAIEILVNRIDDALVRGHVERGAESFARLERWAPADPETAEARWWLAIARDDVTEEREALETLLLFDSERRDVLERLAALDVDAGELQKGLARYEALMIRFPDDPSLIEQVDRARFRWRLSNLPPVVHELAEAPELTRANFATLLYWLIPEVRYSELRDPPIATDILSHERRDEIMRVVNLDLLRVNETIHRFRPDNAVERRHVLEALLILLSRAPQPFACLEATKGVDLHSSTSITCESSARCGLILDAAGCLPTARVAGDEVLDLFRRTLDLLGG